MKYEITKHEFEWVLWKNIETKHGNGCYKIMIGSKDACKQKLKELNGARTRKTKSKERRTRRKQSTTSRKNKATKKRD